MRFESKTTRSRRVILSAMFAAVASGLLAGSVSAGVYVQTNLVSDIPGLATLTVPNLKNPWGISFSATSPFWVSNQGTNLSTLYTVNAAGVSKPALQVSIPMTAGGPQGPTGQVNNNTSAFVVGAAPASFIFANLNGTISAWNGGLGTTAQVVATTTGAVYTGLAIASDPTLGPLLYAANGAQGRIDVFNGAFAPISLGTDAFVDNDPALAGLVPFNVQNIGGNIYVTYAPAGRPAQIAAQEGSGAVAVFNTSGTLIRTLIAGSALASPWGVALAPASFGAFGGDLLVGNFSFVESEINAFDPLTGALLGTIPVGSGAAYSPGGLWGLTFGNGGNGGNPGILYFTSGINGEVNGLFASITAVPEPATLALLVLAFAGWAAIRRRASGATPSVA